MSKNMMTMGKCFIHQFLSDQTIFLTALSMETLIVVAFGDFYHIGVAAKFVTSIPVQIKLPSMVQALH